MKRLLSLVLCLVLMLSVMAISAASAEDAQPKFKMVTVSDYQKWSKKFTDDLEFLVPQLEHIFGGAKNEGVDPDMVVFGGDFTNFGKDGDPTTGNAGYHQFLDILGATWPEMTEDKVVRVQGNHDDKGQDAHMATGVYEYEDFIIYLINEDDFPAAMTGYTDTWNGDNKDLDTKTIVENTSAKLKAYLDEQIEAKQTKPILVMTHTGLHFDVDRTDGDNCYAYILCDVINEAAKKLDIIYFFGHNHTNGDEEQGGTVNYYPVGSTLYVTNEDSKEVTRAGVPTKLNFTYTNYGYIGFVMDWGDHIAADGNVNGKPVTKVLSLTEWDFYDGYITVKRYGSDVDVSNVEDATHLPEYDEVITLKNYPVWQNTVLDEYTLSFDTNGGSDVAATTQTAGKIILPAAPAKEGYIFDGWKAEDGTVYAANAWYDLDADATLTVQWVDDVEGIKYNLVNRFKPGYEYIFVYGDKALAVEDGAIVAIDVSDKLIGDKLIVAADEDAAAYVWECVCNQGSNPAEGYQFLNMASKLWLNHVDAALGLGADPMGVEFGKTSGGGGSTSSVDFQYYTWHLASGKLINYNDSTSFIVPADASFALGGIDDADVAIYEKTPVLEGKYVLADALETNEQYLIVNANAAGEAVALANNARTVTTVAVEIKADENGDLYIDYTGDVNDIAVYSAYAVRENGGFWLDNWQNEPNGPGYSSVIRFNSSDAISPTNNHADNTYKQRFDYVDGALVAYTGLEGNTVEVTLGWDVEAAAFANNTENAVYLFKFVPAN